MPLHSRKELVQMTKKDIERLEMKRDELREELEEIQDPSDREKTREEVRAVEACISKLREQLGRWEARKMEKKRMKVDEELTQKTFSVGRRGQELFRKLVSALDDELPPNIEIGYYECDELTFADDHDQEKYGEDTLFVFPAFNHAEKELLKVIVKRNGSIQPHGARKPVAKTGKEAGGGD